MRWTVITGIVVLSTTLACGFLGTPPPELHDVRAGACGTIEGSVSGDGELVVITVDGTQAVSEYAPTDGSRRPWSVPADPGTHVVSHTETDFEQTLVVPPPPIRVDWPGFGRDVRQGQRLDPVLLQFVSACGTERFTATVLLDGAEVVRAGAVDNLMFSVGSPKQGSHTIEVVSLYDGTEVQRQQLTFEVGPPCTEGSCKDRDGDGHDGPHAGGDDCDDDNAAVHPGATRFPDPDRDGAVAVASLDFDCDGEIDTFDGPFDCDESDPRIPRDEELEPTNKDEDCDGLVDEGTRAYDDDGDGVTEDGGDCRDDDPRVKPGARELPDCKDNDCNGTVDDGLTRPQTDDRYEPNDTRPWALEGAKKMRGFFGGYHETRESVQLVLRDRDDVETFTLFAHDGTLDHFHVTVQVDSIPDGLTYDVRVSGPNSKAQRMSAIRGVASADGGLEPNKMVTTGRGFSSDTGEYTIEIRAMGPVPPYCPLELTVSSG